MPLITDNRWKHSAARFGGGDFERGSPLLIPCMSTVFLSYLGNHWPFLISVSWFWAYVKQEIANQGQIYSVVRIDITKFESGSFKWIFIREFLQKATIYAHETCTFIIYFYFMLWTVSVGDCSERFVTTALNSIALRHRFASCANFAFYFLQMCWKDLFWIWPGPTRDQLCICPANRGPDSGAWRGRMCMRKRWSELRCWKSRTDCRISIRSLNLKRYSKKHGISF